MSLRKITSIAMLTGLLLDATAAHAASACDKACLESIGDKFRAAWAAHDPKLAPFARKVRFTENFVAMDFPDGSWETITQEVGPALTLSDPKTGQVGIYTDFLQNDTQSFLAARLKVVRGRITEIEQVVSTRRNLSTPTPIGDVHEYKHDPNLDRRVAPEKRISRARLVAHADGYFSTLQNNTGEIRGTRFAPDATRFENGQKFADIEAGFRLGRYRFNDRVRDRDHFLVDEERQIVMSRAFIDHKGVLDTYTLTNGVQTRSGFREPHTWAMMEMFKINDDMISGVQATFIHAPYYMRSPFSSPRTAR